MFVVDCTNPAKALLEVFNAAVAREVERKSAELQRDAEAKVREAIARMFGDVAAPPAAAKSRKPRARKPRPTPRAAAATPRKGSNRGNAASPKRADHRAGTGRACGKCGKVTKPSHNARSCDDDGEGVAPVRETPAPVVGIAVHKPLTGREADIVSALSRGVPRTELAADLGIGDGTVKTHIKGILKKTGDRDTGELQARLIRGAPPPASAPTAPAPRAQRLNRIAERAERTPNGRLKPAELSRRAIIEARRPPRDRQLPDEDQAEASPVDPVDLATLPTASFGLG